MGLVFYSSAAFTEPPPKKNRSLMMCRLSRAGLSNNIISISKRPLLPHRPTSCGMLHRAGRVLPLSAASLALPYCLSDSQPSGCCLGSKSELLCADSIREQAWMQRWSMDVAGVSCEASLQLDRAFKQRASLLWLPITW